MTWHKQFSSVEEFESRPANLEGASPVENNQYGNVCSLAALALERVFTSAPDGEEHDYSIMMSGHRNQAGNSPANSWSLTFTEL